MYPPPPHPYYQPSPYYRHPVYPPYHPGYPPMPPEYMGHPYPYPMPPPHMPYGHAPNGVQPALSAIPRGGSAGSLKGGEDGEDAVTTNGDPSEPANKKRKRSHSPDGHASSSARAKLSNGATNGHPELSLDTPITLAADEAATVVALLQHATGHAPLSAAPSRMVDVLRGIASAVSMSEADADGDTDADGEADLEFTGEQGQRLLNPVEPPPPPLDHVLTEDGEPMLNPGKYSIICTEGIACIDGFLLYLQPNF